jgi:hypothetical protein
MTHRLITSLAITACPVTSPKSFFSSLATIAMTNELKVHCNKLAGYNYRMPYYLLTVAYKLLTQSR